MKTFIIDTMYWMRGKADGELLCKTKNYANMCCLGHICLQSGVPKEKLVSIGTPEDILDEYETGETTGKINFLLSPKRLDNFLSEDAISINDDPEISDEERIKKLKVLFKKHNIVLKFV